MSNYIDRFISQHKEYFLRNKKVIEDNKWDQRNINSDKIKELHSEINVLRDKNTDEALDQIKKIEDQIYSLNESSRKNKASLFSQENKLVKSILSRLSAFIKEIEKIGDRKEIKAQKFIDKTLDIINIHIKKCNEYLNYSLDSLNDEADTEQEIDLKSYEIIFQDSVFASKIDIEDTLDNLNLSGDIENTSIRFFNDMKASLPMIDVLPAINSDIHELTEKLKLTNNITDKDFYILKKRRGDKIPKWDEKKHYWEQKPEVLSFWWNEWLKIKQGIEIDGYFIHPWLYYHLNFYKTPIPQADGSEPTTNPRLRDNEWWIAENLKKIDQLEGRDRGLLLYGSRRFAKSVSMSSICDWKALTKANASTSIKSGSSGDLTELTDKINTSMTYMEPAFRLYKNGDWSNEIFIGIRIDANNNIAHSYHKIKNLVGGAKTSTQKTAGGAPSISLYEEIGKAPWEKAFRAEIPAFSGENGWKTILIAVGTSGEAALSGDAMMAVTNPESFSFLEMDWDLFESKLPEDFEPTWKRRTFATFVPGQMGNFPKAGFRRLKRGFGDFLGIKSDLLDQITIEQTDWITNTAVIKDERKRLEKSAFALQQITVQYPIDPEECFLSPDENPLPYLEARAHKEHIITTGDIGKKVYLYKDTQGNIQYDLAENKVLSEYPHTGGFIDSPVLLFEEIPEVKPPYGLYTAGFDDYKQEESQNSESVGTLYIYKRDFPGVKNGGRIAASIASRPDPHKKLYKQWHLMLEAFNVMAFGENEDMAFKTYLETQKIVPSKYLVNSMDFESEEQIRRGGIRRFGWNPTPKNKKYLFGLFKSFCWNEFTIEDEEGNQTTVLGVQTIKDIGLLDEIINYSKDKNVDRITSMMGALGYDFHLFLENIFPRTEDIKKNIIKKEDLTKKDNLAQRMFGKKNIGNYFR